MAGTNSVAAKQAIVAKLQAAPALSGVQVEYIFPGKRLKMECIYGGQIRFDDEYMAFSSQSVGAGRMPRLETATITFTIIVRRPDSDQVKADLRVVALGTVIEEAIAGDPTLSGGAMCAEIRSGDLEPLIDDNGVAAQMIYTIQVRSELI